MRRRTTTAGGGVVVGAGGGGHRQYKGYEGLPKTGESEKAGEGDEETQGGPMEAQG